MTQEQKIIKIEKAIDAIYDVAVDIPESDAHYFLHSEKSVISNLNSIKYKIAENELVNIVNNTIKKREEATKLPLTTKNTTHN